MIPIPAVDAVLPAFARTREVLACRLGTFFKFALVATLAEIGCVSVTLQLPLRAVMRLSRVMQQARPPAGTRAVSLLAPFFAIAILAAIWLLLSYVFTRLRFVVFDFVVRRTTSVSQSWRSHGPASWRFYGLNLLALLSLTTVLLMLAAPFLIGLLGAIRTRNPAAILPHMLAFLLGAVAASFLVHVVDSVLRDFVLPQMALEDASIEQSAAGCFRMFRESPGEVILYLLLKFAVTLALVTALTLLVILGAIVIGLNLAVIGLLLFQLLWAAGTAGRTLVIAYGILAGLTFAVLDCAAMIAASNVRCVFRTAYAAYFFGSRYPVLGNLLEPSSPVVESPAVPQVLLPSPLPSSPALW